MKERSARRVRTVLPALFGHGVRWIACRQQGASDRMYSWISEHNEAGKNLAMGTVGRGGLKLEH